MTISFSSSLWRPLLASATVGSILIAAMVVFASRIVSSQNEAARWVQHTIQVLNLLRELEEQADSKADVTMLLEELKNETADNPSQQRRISALLASSLSEKELHAASLTMRGEEYRLMGERIVRLQDDTSITQGAIWVLLGLLLVQMVVSLLFVRRAMQRRARNIDVLAIAAETAITSAPNTEANDEIIRTMREVRESLRKNL